MPVLDTLGFPALDTVLTRAAELINSIQLPAATPSSVAVTFAAIPALLALYWLARRLTAKPQIDPTLAARFDDLSQRLQTTEVLLADGTNETIQLRQRVDQLTSRQETIIASTSRSSLRQAIALSKHGATTRQLIDTCGLSQGEAHLIQTLYGSPSGATQPQELH